jgi:hypothetical protein
MLSLATDVQKIIIEFLDLKEIKALYETCKESKVMFEEQTNQTNFIIDCKRIISNIEIKWLKLKNIKLKLLETYYKDNDGDQFWFKNGIVNRDNDLPAAIYTDGTKKWFRNGLLHRDNDLPAIIYPHGRKFYYKYGECRCWTGVKNN